jgi:nucleotide-binding universal stress UspA family protein
MSRFRKIVVGIDFSDASLAGARWVATHLSPDAELLLVHVVALPRTPTYLREHMGSTIDHRSMQMPRLYSALREFADLLRPHRVRVGIRTGVPWTALAQVASEVKADLISVGRGHQRHGSARFGATTPQRLIGVSPVPVLVIPQGAVAKPTRVICALSGRPGGEGVIPVARQLAIGWGSSLEPIHAIETDVRQFSRASMGKAGELGAIASIRGSAEGAPATPPSEHRSVGIDSLDEDVLRLLAAEWMAGTLADAGAVASERLAIRVGDAGQALVALTQDKPTQSVIVMGRIGESLSPAASRAQFRCGSTTRMVLWAAPCPVFVLPLEVRASAAPPSEWRSSDVLLLSERERTRTPAPLTRSKRSPYDGDDAA